MSRLGVDYAWTHPDPAAIKTAGYEFVVRYLSHDPSKDITPEEVASLHAVGLLLLLVFETTANRAGQGQAAGIMDRQEAEARAAELGYPQGCPIFYAVDFDATPQQVASYFAGVRGGNYPAGLYGGVRVVDAGLAAWLWQTEAWSGGVVSAGAHLFQRIGHTLPPLPGVPADSYDENVLCKMLPMWGGSAPEEDDMAQWWHDTDGTEWALDAVAKRRLTSPAQRADLQNVGLLSKTRRDVTTDIDRARLAQTPEVK